MKPGFKVELGPKKEVDLAALDRIADIATKDTAASVVRAQPEPKSKQVSPQQKQLVPAVRESALTIMLPPELHSELRIAAASRGVTVRALVLDGLRATGFNVEDDTGDRRRRSA
jgi:hypothetical protein